MEGNEEANLIRSSSSGCPGPAGETCPHSRPIHQRWAPTESWTVLPASVLHRSRLRHN